MRLRLLDFAESGEMRMILYCALLLCSLLMVNFLPYDFPEMKFKKFE